MTDRNHEETGREGGAPRPEPFPVVGIGASAGGLAALEKLFRAMPEDSGLALVVVQHLHPERESHMTELIGRYTEMPVVSVENGVRVQPDHVYVILRGQQLTIADGRTTAAPFGRRTSTTPVGRPEPRRLRWPGADPRAPAAMSRSRETPS